MELQFYVYLKTVTYFEGDEWKAPEARDRLKKLAAMPDSEIDYSDLPPWTHEMWKTAIRNPFYKPVKKQLTVRVDADVLAWLKQKGAGYQTRINAVLRQAMLADRTK